MSKKSKSTRSIIAFLLAVILTIQPFSMYIGEAKAAEEAIDYNTGVDEISDTADEASDEAEITDENAEVSEQSEAEDQILNIEETAENDSESETEEGTADVTEETDADFTDSPEAGADQLTIAANDTQIIDLDADTTYTGITMEDGSTLTVNTNSHKLTVTDGITGTGTVILNGNGTVEIGDSKIAKIETSSLILENVTVNAQNKTVTATDSFTISNSTVNNASLVGYADSVSGKKTLTLENVTLSNVSAFGVSENGTAKVSYDVSKFTSISNSVLYQDYALTYFYNKTTLTSEQLGSDYANSYRVKTAGNTTSIVGYHEANDGYVSATSVQLPTFTEAGYQYNGWYVDDSETPVTEISSGTGAHSLTAALQAETYTVTLDLGYTVTDDTNDDSLPTGMTLDDNNQTETLNKNPGETIELPTPKRFGYDFKGWELKKSSESYDGGDSYTVNVTDSDADKQIQFKAKWEAKEFSRIRFDFSNVVPVGNIEFDGQTIKGYLETNAGISWTEGTTVILCGSPIKYGESLNAYLSRLGVTGGLPTLTDGRTGAEKTAFSGWTTLAGLSVSNDSVYVMGDLVKNRTTETLEEYEDEMSKGSVVIQAKWGTQSYKVTGLPDNDNWSYAYQTAGSEQKISVDVKTDGTVRYIEVPQGSTVILSCKAGTDESITQWSFKAKNGDHLSVSQETYTDGTTYDYTFTMPACDVEASYSSLTDKNYVNIEESPISFVENISYKGRTGLKGFWYEKYMEKGLYEDMVVNAMTPLFHADDISDTNGYADPTGTETAGYYFYEYNFSKYPFYITSKNGETQNQIVLVNKAEISLKACKLVATDTFNEQAIGSTLGEKSLADDISADLKEYGNIVVDRSQNNYEATLRVEGDNTVACISTQMFVSGASYYNAISIVGTSNKTDSLTLGSVMGCFAVNFTNLTINQYDKKDTTKNFQPIVAVTHRGDASIESRMTNCVLNASERSWSGTYRSYFTNSQIDIKEFPVLHYYTSQPNYNNCKVHVYGDMNTQFTLVVQGNTFLTVDGSLVQASQNYTHTDTINTTGTVLVKGNRCDLGVLNMMQGTLICNQLMVSQYSGFKGGTVVTNLLSERANYSIANTTESNADGYPFARTVSNANGTFDFTFSGSKVYLFGHYTTVDNGSYDARLDNTSTTMDADNPVKTFADGINGETGTVTFTDTGLNSAVEAAAASAAGTECVALGSTAYADGSSVIRNVNISGGSICAAGNITFYNDTTISGGSVTAYGSLASKRDLLIQGGTVTAREVGNAYNTSRTENENQRWAQTVITGGTVKTDRIGALISKIRSVEAKSYVSIDKDKATITPFTDGSKIAVSSDIKVNYHLLNGLKVDSGVTNPDNARYLCTTYNTSESLKGQLKLSESDSAERVEFTDPKEADGTTASWTFDSVQGETANYFDNEGKLNGDETADYIYCAKKTIELYAVKNSNTLTIRAGEEMVKNPQITADSSTTDITFTDQKATVSAGSTVTFSVPAEMKDKVIINYYDDNKVLYNACTQEPTENTDGTYQYSFTMPHTDTEIWVSTEFNLYLNRYPVTFTADGFATEYGTKSGSSYTFDQTRSFSYQGDILVSEEGMTTARNEEYFRSILSNSATPLTYTDSATTANQIHFTKDFDNISEGKNSRKVILTQLVQKYTDIGSNQTVLEKGTKARLEIKGHVGLYRVHVPESADIEICGWHTENGADGRPQDSLWLIADRKETTQGVSLGAQAEKCGNITLDTLFVCQKDMNGGKIGSNFYSDPTATLTMKNCTLIHRNLYENTSIAQNLKEVVLDNCRFDIAISDTWPGTLITNCMKVSLINGTVYELSYGAQYLSYSPFTANRITGSDNYYKNYYKDAEFVIDSSTMNIKVNKGSNQRIYHSFGWMYQVKLKGTGSLAASRYLSLDKLTMEDSSSVKVGDDSHCGYLFCSDIEVKDNAKLEAGYIAVSGFDTIVDINALPDHHNVSATSEEEWRRGIENNTQHILDGKDYNGLVMTGGTVTASKFVGGDVNGKIKISDGTLNAPKIGNYGAYMGILLYEPTTDTDEKWCLFYDRIPTAGQSAVVNITGGTVNVTEDGYLGGINATVNITGGKVNIANGAVFGMTDAQKETLQNSYLLNGDSIDKHTDNNINVSIGDTATVEADYTEPPATGSISIPYGQLSITGSSHVKTAAIRGLGGTVTVEATNESYKNPYPETGEVNWKGSVGVYLTDGTDTEADTGILEAKMIQVAKGARIYAPKVRAVTENQEGGIKVADPTTSGNEGSGIYCTSYLVSGTGGTKDYNNTSNNAKQNIFNKRAEIAVVYKLNPESSGNEMEAADAARIQNDPDNVESFVYQEKDSDGQCRVALKDASCTGYNFEGWYTSEDYTQKYNDYISTDKVLTEQLTLYAKWSKIQVKFSLVIDKDSHGSFTGDMTSEFTGLENIWTKVEKDGSTYYQTAKPVSIPYGDQILGISGINLENYATNTMLALSVAFDGKWTSYTGTDLNGDVNKVSLNLAEFYKQNCTADNDVILLHVNNMTNRDARITFDLNRGSSISSVPAFKDGSSSARTIVLEVFRQLVESTEVTGDTTGDKYTHSSGLTVPTAAGYTFYGWNTNKDATYETADGWVNSDDSFEVNTTLYAVWRANTYKIRFQVKNPDNQDDTGRSFVTANSTEPSANAEETVSMERTWVYDTPMTAVPVGWREGYTFDSKAGWKYQYTAEDGTAKTGSVTEGMKLNLAEVAGLDIAAGDPDGNPTDMALVLNADFKPVRVTYHLEGGTMTGQEDQTVTLENYKYGDALCGYTENAGVTNNNKEVLGEYFYQNYGGNTKSYGVVSTTAAYYTANKDYVENDYRKALSRKGYTFQGWNTAADGEGKTIGSLPRFADVELYAQWTANTYALELYEQDSTYTYADTKFGIKSGAPKSGVTAKVTVGETISVIDANWPKRDGDWYAYSGDTDAQQRYLLGFTFASLDPGNSDPNAAGDGYQKVYRNYAKATTQMINGDTLFRNGGTVFSLPEDQDYRDQIEVSYDGSGSRKVADVSVADYPAGSTIIMYAVYNERSLIFMETYRDPDGNTVSEVKYSGQVDTYYDYPSKYDQKTDGSYNVGSRNDIESQGYSLIGWYVNGTETKFAESADEYSNNLESYKDEAKKNGTYDVIVYTVFAAVKTQPGMTLTASDDPKAADWPVSDSFTIPNSMQDGKLSMQVVSDTLKGELKLVSDTDMSQHLYDSSWGDSYSYSADNTVAVRVTATSPDGEKVSGCVDQSEMVNFGGTDKWQTVGAGWTIQLELIHSKVMSERAKKNMTFDLKFCFTSKTADNYESGDNLLKEQWILFDDVTVNLKPSMYTVNYTLDLPEAESKLDVREWNGFTAPQGDTRITWSVKVPYGKDLHQAPEIVGYTVPVDGAGKTEWTLSGGNTYTSLNMDMSAANGQISVSNSYTANEYNLTVSDKLSDWVISYTDGVGGNTETTVLAGNKANVKYHSVITIKPADSKSPAAEFVTLTMDDETVSKLSEYNGYGSNHTNNIHSLAMLERDLYIGWNDVQTLYLDNGTIELDAASYKQNGETHSWSGNYVIWQNAENNNKPEREGGHPENTLKISGDLSEREIRVGNLQITADDSISLTKDAKAVLTLNYTGRETVEPSAVSAKNIFVPAGNDFDTAVLTLQTEVTDSKAEITLSPTVSRAAIGGSIEACSGNITVEDMKVMLHMPADSTASGIGAGSSVSGTASHTVNVTGCEVIVDEVANGINQYKGAWIGGKTVAAVNISGSVVKPLTTTTMVGPLITDGSVVTISNSSIGTSEKPVNDPVYAENELNITTNSMINQHIGMDLKSAQVNVPVGTDSGSTTVTESVIKSVVNAADVADLYSGTMKITDVKSDVKIGVTQIVEISNGSLEIKDSGYTQDGVKHSHTGSYQLLEVVKQPAEAPALALTVDSLGTSAVITAKSDLTFDTVSVNADTPLVLKGNVTITNKAAIADEKTLTVTADENSEYGLNVKGGFDDSTRGNYVQTNGKLSGSSLVVGGNLTLNHVTAVAENGNLGSSDADSDKADKVTTVTLNGGSISAGVIGAAGISQETFTFLKMENAPTWTGKLVQDHYRIAYDKSGNANLNTESLTTVVRTETTKTGSTETVKTVDPENGIPGNPTETDTSLFSCWYMIDAAGNRKALIADDTTLPAGLSARASLVATTPEEALVADVSQNEADGTETLTVHAWLEATGATTIKKGRSVTAFSDGTESVSGIPTNGTWTAQLVCTGGNTIAGRDYRVEFQNALPKGTELTIANPVTKNGSTTTIYYRYKVAGDNVTSVNFSAFTKMGTTDDKMSLAADTSVNSEIFLLSADYAKAESAPSDGTVKFILLPGGTDRTDHIDFTAVSYSVTETHKGTVRASGSTVTVTEAPADSECPNDQKIFLAAKLSDAESGSVVKVPFGTKAVLEQGNSTVNGIWVSRDTVVFEISDPDNTEQRVVNFSGLGAGSYQLTWNLVYGTDARANIMGNRISNTDQGAVTVADKAPCLSVQMTESTHVISAGETKKVNFTYNTTETNVTAKVQKQGRLGSFSDVTDMRITVVVNNDGIATVTFGSDTPAGTYRICFSMNDQSTEDDVYFTFIVK